MGDVSMSMGIFLVMLMYVLREREGFWDVGSTRWGYGLDRAWNRGMDQWPQCWVAFSAWLGGKALSGKCKMCGELTTAMVWYCGENQGVEGPWLTR